MKKSLKKIALFLGIVLLLGGMAVGLQKEEPLDLSPRYFFAT